MAAVDETDEPRKKQRKLGATTSAWNFFLYTGNHTQAYVTALTRVHLWLPAAEAGFRCFTSVKKSQLSKRDVTHFLL